MKSSLFFGNFKLNALTLTALLFTTSVLSGCVGMPLLYAAQFIPVALVGYQFLPGGVEAELSNPNGGVTSSSFKSVQTILTDNQYSYEYLNENPDGLFKRVNLAKTSPLSTRGAASMAQKGGYDAFLLVDASGYDVETGFISSHVVYGSATVTMVSKNGDILYKQKATLKSKMNSAKQLSEREVLEMLAKVIVTDLKNGRTVAQAPADDTKESNALRSVKNFFR